MASNSNVDEDKLKKSAKCDQGRIWNRTEQIFIVIEIMKISLSALLLFSSKQFKYKKHYMKISHKIILKIDAEKY